MSDEQKPPTDEEVKGLIKQMIQAGRSEDEITKFVQQYDDIGHPVKAIIGGTVEGLGQGVWDGIVALPALARDVVMDGISMLQGESPANAKQFVESLHDFLPTFEQAGPREKARMLAELTTSLGAGAGEVAGAVSKPSARAIGRALEYAGDHPFATRMSGAAGMVTGLARGNPELAVAGMAGMALPPVMKSAGERLIRIGGGLTKEDAVQQTKFADAMTNRNVSFADEQAKLAEKAAKAKAPKVDPSSSGTRELDFGEIPKSTIRIAPSTGVTPAGARVPMRGPEPAPYRTAAKAAEKADVEAERARKIQAETEGMTPKSTVKETESGTTPEGTRVSKTTTYAPDKAADALTPSLAQELGISEEELQILRRRFRSDDQIRQVMKGAAPGNAPLVSGGPARPPIRVGGPTTPAPTARPPIQVEPAVAATPAPAPSYPSNVRLGSQAVSKAAQKEMEGDIRSRMMDSGVHVETSPAKGAPNTVAPTESKTPATNTGTTPPTFKEWIDQVETHLKPSKSKDKFTAGGSSNDVLEASNLYQENPHMDPQDAAREIERRRASRRATTIDNARMMRDAKAKSPDED